MWLTCTCDYHVLLLLLVRVVDALLCHNDVRCHDSHMTSCILCAQENTRCVPDSFLLLGVGGGGLGTRLGPLRLVRSTPSLMAQRLPVE